MMYDVTKIKCDKCGNAIGNRYMRTAHTDSNGLTIIKFFCAVCAGKINEHIDGME